MLRFFENISRLCGAPLVGLDFICQDISAPYHRQECAVLEANSLPYIDMHHYPVTGQPRNVAEMVMDYVLWRRMMSIISCARICLWKNLFPAARKNQEK